jgi:hypothetical protein
MDERSIEPWREPRLWMTLAMVAAVVVLAGLRTISGDAVLAFLAGLLARWGANRTLPPVGG